jgi:hypothetical protein
VGQVAKVSSKVADLIALRRQLAQLILTCAVGTIADYRIVEALALAT